MSKELKIKVGDGIHDYDNIPVLKGTLTKKSLDDLVDELTAEAIDYVNGQGTDAVYTGDRSDLDYTPRVTDLSQGIIEDAINVYDGKVTSNYQFEQVNKKLDLKDFDEDAPGKVIANIYLDGVLKIKLTDDFLDETHTTAETTIENGVITYKAAYINTVNTITGTLADTGESVTELKYLSFYKSFYVENTDIKRDYYSLFFYYAIENNQNANIYSRFNNASSSLQSYLSKNKTFFSNAESTIRHYVSTKVDNQWVNENTQYFFQKCTYENKIQHIYFASQDNLIKELEDDFVEYQFTTKNINNETVSFPIKINKNTSSNACFIKNNTCDYAGGQYNIITNENGNLNSIILLDNQFKPFFNKCLQYSGYYISENINVQMTEFGCPIELRNTSNNFNYKQYKLPDISTSNRYGNAMMSANSESKFNDFAEKAHYVFNSGYVHSLSYETSEGGTLLANIIEYKLKNPNSEIPTNIIGGVVNAVLDVTSESISYANINNYVNSNYSINTIRNSSSFLDLRKIEGLDPLENPNVLDIINTSITIKEKVFAYNNFVCIFPSSMNIKTNYTFSIQTNTTNYNTYTNSSDIDFTDASFFVPTRIYIPLIDKEVYGDASANSRLIEFNLTSSEWTTLKAVYLAGLQNDDAFAIEVHAYFDGLFYSTSSSGGGDTTQTAYQYYKVNYINSLTQAVVSTETKSLTAQYTSTIPSTFSGSFNIPSYYKNTTITSSGFTSCTANSSGLVSLSLAYNENYTSSSYANLPEVNVTFVPTTRYYQVSTYLDSVLTGTSEVQSVSGNSLTYFIDVDDDVILANVTPAYTNDSDGNFIFDVSENTTAANALQISVYYNSTGAQTKTWANTVVGDYTYGWVLNLASNPENTVQTSAGTINYALMGWPTNGTYADGYDEDATEETQTWYPQYWALKSNVATYSINESGTKQSGFKTKFTFANAVAGESYQIWYWNSDNECIAKSPKINVV